MVPIESKDLLLSSDLPLDCHPGRGRQRESAGPMVMKAGSLSHLVVPAPLASKARERLGSKQDTVCEAKRCLVPVLRHLARLGACTG